MSALDRRLHEQAEATLAALRGRLGRLKPQLDARRVGRVIEVGDGVAIAVGVEAPVAGELLDVGGIPARAEIVSDERIHLVLLGEGDAMAGAVVRRLGRVLDVPAGAGVIGRVIDPVGRPLDDLGPLRTRERVVVDGAPIPLLDREPVTRPLRTGVFVVDAMIPVGRGQRQLIIGDRSTGKSELGVDILAALGPDLVGVYVAIGRRGAEVSGFLEELRRAGFFERGFAVVATADAPLGQIHLAPYTAFAIAESLMLRGRDVVVILDDLTAHAHAHRTLALLLDRPVGREAFPVDVFYAHARLLERATQLGARRGGGSLTALPIIETQAGDLAAYIPTNLVSITDGQIRMDAGLVAEHQLPAVDVSLSVSRVGGKAQPATLRKLAGSVKNRYALFLELETFSRFGAQLEATTQRVIDWGRRTRLLLRQERAKPLGWPESVIRLLVLQSPEVTRVPLAQIHEAADRALQRCRERLPEPLRKLAVGKKLEDAELRALAEHVEAALRPLLEPVPEASQEPPQPLPSPSPDGTAPEAKRGPTLAPQTAPEAP
jgi:F-type H+-transporting ATPase subunit alpha